MDAPYAIGVEVGGSEITAGLVDEQGRILVDRHVATPLGQGSFVVLDAILRCTQGIVDEAGRSSVAGVGIGLPAQVDFERQEVEFSEFVPLVGADIRTLASSQLGISATIDAEANLAALGEQRFGAVRNVRDFAVITLGTGIGVGFIFDGKLYRGAHGLAGSLGHIVINQGGAPCACGGQGHLASEFFEAQSPERRVELLATGLVSLINLLNPRVILIGGAVGARDAVLIKEAARRAGSEALAGRKDLRIEAATLGSDAGVLGGAALAFAEAEERERFAL